MRGCEIAGWVVGKVEGRGWGGKQKKKKKKKNRKKKKQEKEFSRFPVGSLFLAPLPLIDIGNGPGLGEEGLVFWHFLLRVHSSLPPRAETSLRIRTDTMANRLLQVARNPFKLQFNAHTHRDAKAE